MDCGLSMRRPTPITPLSRKLTKLHWKLCTAWISASTTTKSAKCLSVRKYLAFNLKLSSNCECMHSVRSLVRCRFCHGGGNQNPLCTGFVHVEAGGSWDSVLESVQWHHFDWIQPLEQGTILVESRWEGNSFISTHMLSFFLHRQSTDVSGENNFDELQRHNQRAHRKTREHGWVVQILLFSPLSRAETAETKSTQQAQTWIISINFAKIVFDCPLCAFY